MSPIAIDRGRIRNDGAAILLQSACIAAGNSSESGDDGRSEASRLRLIVPAAEAENQVQEGEYQQVEEENSCSSSIGRNSDCSERSADFDGEEEVESAPRGALDSTDALEAALPMRRSISKFYTGKSKSFTSLTEVSSSYSKDIAKPENAYTRKRKNLLAFTINWDPRRQPPPTNAGRAATKRQVPPPRPPPHPHPHPPRRLTPPPRCHLSVRSLSMTDLSSASDPAPPSILGFD